MDYAVADISTLNPNAIYELGIRHALRPYSTLVIAEDGIREFPFDINHVRIEKYKHLGEDIGVGEAKRFIKLLRAKIQSMLDEQVCDSPVYTFIEQLKPPYIDTVQKELSGSDLSMVNFTINEKKPLPGANNLSLTELVNKAEAGMKENNYKKALKLYKEASLRDKQNIYLKQKIVLSSFGVFFLNIRRKSHRGLAHANPGV